MVTSPTAIGTLSSKAMNWEGTTRHRVEGKIYSSGIFLEHATGASPSVTSSGSFFCDTDCFSSMFHNAQIAHSSVFLQDTHWSPYYEKRINTSCHKTIACGLRRIIYILNVKRFCFQENTNKNKEDDAAGTEDATTFWTAVSIHHSRSLPCGWEMLWDGECTERLQRSAAKTNAGKWNTLNS